MLIFWISYMFSEKSFIKLFPREKTLRWAWLQSTDISGTLIRFKENLRKKITKWNNELKIVLLMTSLQSLNKTKRNKKHHRTVRISFISIQRLLLLCPQVVSRFVPFLLSFHLVHPKPNKRFGSLDKPEDLSRY